MSPYFQQPVALCSLYLHQMARLHGLGFVCQAALYTEAHCCRCTGDIQQFHSPRITKVALNLTHFAILLDQDPYHLSHNLFHKCTLSFVTIMWCIATSEFVLICVSFKAQSWYIVKSIYCCSSSLHCNEVTGIHCNEVTGFRLSIIM